MAEGEHGQCRQLARACWHWGGGMADLARWAWVHPVMWYSLCYCLGLGARLGHIAKMARAHSSVSSISLEVLQKLKRFGIM